MNTKNVDDILESVLPYIEVDNSFMVMKALAGVADKIDLLQSNQSQIANKIDLLHAGQSDISTKVTEVHAVQTGK